MKLRTSFSNLTVYRKDLTRFAPVWILYVTGILLVLGGNLTSRANDVPGLIKAFGIVNLIYAGVIGVMLFGDLYNTRMCYSLHAMPQRRENWLVSHLAAGLTFSLIPNLLAATMIAAGLEEQWFLALYWLLAVTLQFVFFFGVATVSALLVGNRFAALAVYAGLNFVSMLAYWLILTVYMPLLEGVVLEMRPFILVCPVVGIFNYDYMKFDRLEILDEFGESHMYYQFAELGSGWPYLAVLVAVGLGLMALGILLYRWRHLECAGDFVAFPKLNGLSCVIMTLCTAGALAFVGEEIITGEGFLLWFAVGLVVGWFGSRMLLQRRLRVFQVRAFVGLAVLAAILVGSFLTFYYDVLGIKYFVPEVDQVKSVTIANYQVDEWSGYYGDQLQVTLEDPAEIEEILAAHEDILEKLEDPVENGRYTATIIYKLKDGRTVHRYYRPGRNSASYAILQKYWSDPALILGYPGYSWEDYTASITNLRTNWGEIPAAARSKVLEALRADCLKGTVGLNGTKDTIAWVYVESIDPDGKEVYRSLQISRSAHQTLGVLNTPQVILGATELEQLQSGMDYLYVEGMDVDEAHWQTMAEMLWKDCTAGNITVSEEQIVICTMDFAVRVNGKMEHRYVMIGEDAVNTIGFLEEIGILN